MNDVRINLTDDDKKITYSVDEICPCCGTYTADGGVCDKCLKEYNLYKPKIIYSEL